MGFGVEGLGFGLRGLGSRVRGCRHVVRVSFFLVKPVDFAQPKNGREGNAGSHQVWFQKGLGTIQGAGLEWVRRVIASMVV